MRSILTCLCLSIIMFGKAQDPVENIDSENHLFVAYELGEALFNKFQSYSGEVGVMFSNHHLLRLAHMNVNLTEEHLSSSFARAVDGPDVEGKLFGFEVFYDLPIIKNKWYVGPSIGYYRNDYNHIRLSDALRNHSATVGAAISYRERNIFGIKGLYYTFSIPMRVSLSPVEETRFADTLIRSDAFDNNIWLFIGYEF